VKIVLVNTDLPPNLSVFSVEQIAGRLLKEIEKLSEGQQS
jgi:hypothetical protein